MKCPEQANPQRQKVDSWLPGIRGWEWGVTAPAFRVSFWGAETVLELDSSDGGTTLNTLKTIEPYTVSG